MVGQIQQKQVLDDGTVLMLYKTQGTCSQYIEVGVRDERVISCRFLGGCDGNTKGLSQLVIGMKMDDVISRLDGIRCGMKSTSCPDQLCRALEMCTSNR